MLTIANGRMIETLRGPMPTRNINLTPEMDSYVVTQIETGQYANVSEVLRAGLRALQQKKDEDQAKLEFLRKAIQDGEESGIAEGDVFGRVVEHVRQYAALRRRA